ncbi:MAG TPA: hypothetical protein VF185_03120 [Patescibacteria group bacterium]
MSEPISEVPTQPKAPKVIIGNFEQNSPEFYFYRQAAVTEGVSPDFEVVTTRTKQQESYVQMRVPKIMEKRIKDKIRKAMSTPQARVLSKAYWGQPMENGEISEAFGDNEQSVKLTEYWNRRKIGKESGNTIGIEPFAPSEMENLINEVYNTLPEQKK